MIKPIEIRLAWIKRVTRMNGIKVSTFPFNVSMKIHSVPGWKERNRSLSNWTAQTTKWNVNRFFRNVNMTSNAKQFHRYSPSVCLDDQLMKILELQKKKRKKREGEKEIKTREWMESQYRCNWGITFVRGYYWFQNSPPPIPLFLTPPPPLFKTFLVYPREIVLLTQFSLTWFPVNRTGARVRNNSLLKWCSINKLPISFSISSNRSAFRFEGRGREKGNERCFPNFQEYRESKLIASMTSNI